MRIPFSWLPLRGLFAIVARLPTYIRLSFHLMLDARVQWYLKLLYLAVVLYVVSPFDIIPDFILPPLGWVEDIVVYLIALHNLVKYSPADVVKEHAERIAGKGDPPAETV